MTTLAMPPRSHKRIRLGFMSTTRQCLTLAGRNLTELRSNIGEIIGFTLVQPLMMIVLLVYVFGGAIAGDTDSYLQYALPGLIVQQTIFSVLATGAGLNQDLSNGVFDRLRSLPIARIAPLAGHLLGVMVRVTAGLVVLLLVGMVQGFDVTTSLFEAAGGIALASFFGMGLAWISMLVGLLAKSATTVHLFTGVLMFPMTFGSNVFVATETMPGWLRAWADINPVSHLATALRALLGGSPAENSVAATVLWTVGLMAVFAPLAIAAYRRRV